MEEYHNPVLVGEPVKSAVFVPMIAGDHVSGVISLQNIDHENAFGESDVRLLQTLANGMSVALENARLFEETEQRNAELTMINAVQTALASKLDLQGIIDVVGDKISEIFPESNVGISLVDRNHGMIVLPYLFEKGIRYNNVEFPLGQGLTSLVLDTRQPLLINTDFKRRSAEYRLGETRRTD